MTATIQAVVDTLNAGGIPALRAYPWQYQQELTEPWAAVSLSSLDATGWKILVRILAPSKLGGAACEDTAIKAYGRLSAVWQVCIDGACRYDGDSDLFCVELTVQPLV